MSTTPLSPKDLAGRRTLRLVRDMLRELHLEPLPDHQVWWNKGGMAVGGEVTAAGKGWYLHVAVPAPRTYIGGTFVRTNEPLSVYGAGLIHPNHHIPHTGEGNWPNMSKLAMALTIIAKEGRRYWE